MTASAFVLFENTEFSRNAARHGLRILGKNEIFKVNGKVVHDAKLHFKRNRGTRVKLNRNWRDMKLNSGSAAKYGLVRKLFFLKLCCEHYLLYAEAAKTGYRPKTIKIGA